MIEIIGEGSYGLICTCRNVNTGQIFAIKFLEIDEEEEANLQKEIDILKESTACKYVVQYHGCYLKDNTLMIVMELCDGGSCLDMMQMCNLTYTEDQISAICAGMLQGLVHLHSHKIMHRDLKAGNVLITKEGIAKLADFGVSAKLAHTMQKKKTLVGSPYWMAPEIITVQKNDDGYDYKADIWSLGITAIELAEGRPPHYEVASLRIIFLIPVRDPPTLKEPDKWSPEFHDFLNHCLVKDPTKRATAAELLKHPFVQRGMNKEVLLRDLVQKCLPLMEIARKSKKEGEASSSSGADSFAPGTMVVVKSNTDQSNGNYGTFVFHDDDEMPNGELSNQMGTMRLMPDEDGTGTMRVAGSSVKVYDLDGSGTMKFG
eukprot:TRINITY_DN3847_c0_g1_i1.p1 TRINITY_DN3847_c0_g1~~TRINITY_DN3847_c0_g1_i1.p1  ORF type:complete len:437 (+),score=117.38 TRINITY_DN3847_c0_g1_i1:190-1311(+)